MTKVEPMHDKVKRTVAIQGQAHHIVIYEREREYDCDISCMHPVRCPFVVFVWKSIHHAR